MRQALARCVIIVAIVLPVATGGLAQQVTGPCSGTACDHVVVDAKGCEAANKSEHAVALLIIPVHTSGPPPPPVSIRLEPGERKPLRGPAGCPFGSGIRQLMAAFTAAADPTEKPKNLPPSVFGEAKMVCAGTSCGLLSLKVFDGCVWIESYSTDPVAVTAKVGAETLQTRLEGADAAKAAQRQKDEEARKAAAPSVAEARRCANLLKSEALLKQSREQGAKVPYNSDIESGAAACRAAESKRGAPQGSGSDTAYHVSIHDARNIITQTSVVFRVKLIPKSGCVKSTTDVESYTANAVK